MFPFLFSVLAFFLLLNLFSQTPRAKFFSFLGTFLSVLALLFAGIAFFGFKVISAFFALASSHPLIALLLAGLVLWVLLRRGSFKFNINIRGNPGAGKKQREEWTRSEQPDEPSRHPNKRPELGVIDLDSHEMKDKE